MEPPEHRHQKGSALPTLDTLGRDLLETTLWRRIITIGNPLWALTAYAFFSLRQDWVAAFGCVVWFSFVSYGSSSHDLVHRSLGVGRSWNQFFLHVIERLALRSGHAYQIAHLRHHRQFPEKGDIEGDLIHEPWWKWIVGIPLQQFRVWWWAVKLPRSRKVPLALDAIWFLGFVTAAWVYRDSYPQLAVYACLVIAGSWAIPLVTVLLPHRASGRTPMEHTRLYRGQIFDWIFFRHLYHLEHHLYPAVPHHNWKVLGRRLNPTFDRLHLARIVWPLGRIPRVHTPT